MTAAGQARQRGLPAIDPDIRMADGERGLEVATGCKGGQSRN
jgi:hypothetical protein